MPAVTLEEAHAKLPARPPVQLLATPRGPVLRAKSYPRRPYGGPFETIVARGRSQSSNRRNTFVAARLNRKLPYVPRPRPV